MNVIVDCPETHAGEWSFRLFGTPVHTKIFFWIPVALLCPAQDLGPVLIWVAVCLASVLAHEFGHVLALRRLGIHSEVFLYHWGGLTEGRFDPRGLSSRLITALAGPAVGFAIAAATLGAYYLPSQLRGNLYVSSAVAYLFAVNLAWSVINLLPVYPFDGWHAARALFESRDAYRGKKKALVLSAVIGGAVAILGLASRNLYVALAFLVLALCSAQAAEGSSR